MSKQATTFRLIYCIVVLRLTVLSWNIYIYIYLVYRLPTCVTSRWVSNRFSSATFSTRSLFNVLAEVSVWPVQPSQLRMEWAGKMLLSSPFSHGTWELRGHTVWETLVYTNCTEHSSSCESDNRFITERKFPALNQNERFMNVFKRAHLWPPFMVASTLS